MKKTDFLKKLSELTKIDVETLTKVITSDQEEIDITIPELHYFTDEELTARDLNKAKAGNNAAIEMSVKNARNKLVEEFGDEFKFEGKNIDNLLEYAIKAGEKKAGIKPNEQLQEKDKSIKALQESVRKLEEEKNQAIKDKEISIFNNNVDYTLVKKVPYIENSTFSAEEYVALFKRNIEPVQIDGIITYKKNGEIAKDPKTQNPIPIEVGFESFLNEKGIMQSDRRGRGDKDSSNRQISSIQSIKTSNEFDKYCDDNNIISIDAKTTVLREVMKNNPQFTYGQS